MSVLTETILAIAFANLVSVAAALPLVAPINSNEFCCTSKREI